MNLELLNRSLGVQRRRVVIWGAALLILTATVLAVWPSMSASGSLDSLVAGMSPELIAALGLESLASPAGFLNGNLYALILPLLVAALGIMQMSALTAGDEDAGRLELLFALPVSRGSVYLSRFLSVVIVLVAIGVVIGATVALGGAALEMDLLLQGVIAATAGVVLLALFHAALALALAGLGLRAGVVLATAYGVLVLGYLAYALLPMVESLGGLAKASPWHWALGGEPLEHGLQGAGGVLLLGGSIVLVVIGLLGLRRRTIRTA